jgi:hypothetical protein
MARHGRRSIAIAAAIAALGIGGPSRADGVRFRGPHPVAPALVRGMCHIEGPHVHSYEPHKSVLYVYQGGEWTFIGDPVEFDTDAPKFGYYGHHPTFWAEPGVDVDDATRPHFYCYIGGPHHHWYAPPPTLSFQMKGTVFWYVGTPPPYYRQRWRRHSPIDDHYRGVVVVRPIVTVAPPVGFVGVYLPHGHGHGGVSVEVQVPGVGVVFGEGHRRAHGGRHHGRVGPPGPAPAWGRRGHAPGHGGGRGHAKGHRR